MRCRTIAGTINLRTQAKSGKQPLPEYILTVCNLFNISRYSWVDMITENNLNYHILGTESTMESMADTVGMCWDRQQASRINSVCFFETRQGGHDCTEIELGNNNATYFHEVWWKGCDCVGSGLHSSTNSVCSLHEGDLEMTTNDHSVEIRTRRPAKTRVSKYLQVVRLV